MAVKDGYAGPFWVVFEYLTGSHKGGRFITTYETPQDLDEMKRRDETNPPKFPTKIVGIFETYEETHKILEEFLTVEICENILRNTPPEQRLMQAGNYIAALADKVRRGGTID